MFTQMIKATVTAAQESPWQTALGATGSIIALVGALFTVDARYAHAADVDKQETKIEQIIKNTTNALRQQQIEDKLFELDLRKAQNQNGRLSPVDQALRDRYQRQLDELNQKKSES